MNRRLKSIGRVTCVLLALALLLATPAFASGGPPATQRTGKSAPSGNLPGFGEGIYTKSDVKTAAKFLGIDPVELENQLWAGRALSEIADTVGADITALRNAVDAARYRMIAAGKAPGPPLKPRSDDHKKDDCKGDCGKDDCKDDCRKDDCKGDCRKDDCKGDCKKDDCKGDCKGGKPLTVIPHPGMSYPGHPYPGVPYPALRLMRTTGRNGLNLRYGPGTSFGVCVRVPYGTHVQALVAGHWQGGYQWTKILYGGQELWAASMYLAPA